MLGTNQAQEAQNVKLYSQELRHWRAPELVQQSPTPNTKTLYRMMGPAGASVWATWATDVDVCAGPLQDTTDFRYYYTGDGAPKKTNWVSGSSGGGPYPANWLNMGVPAPTAAPTVAVGGTGTGTAEDRVYVYTYVNQFGSMQEESAPSPASVMVAVQTGQTVTVSGFVAPPTANQNITQINIYRSVVGATSTSYAYVASITSSTSSYVDALTAAQLGPNLTTIGQIPPPANLAGLVSLPSGALAGFAGNTVYFSEVYKPHAWPLAYAISIPRAIIGIAVYGTSVVVCTAREPYVIVGPYPGAMTESKVPLMEPCVSKRTIVTDEYGVTYASPNGLVNISDEVRAIVTESLFRRDEWQAIGPANMISAIYDGKYFGGFPSVVIDSTTIIIDRSDRPALSYLKWAPTAIFVDSYTAAFFYVDAADNCIYQQDPPGGLAVTYAWKSKRFMMPRAATFSALQVDANFGQNIPLQDIVSINNGLMAGDILGYVNSMTPNQFEANGSLLLSPGTGYVQVIIFGDGLQVSQSSLYSSDVVRLSPFKSRAIEIQLVGTIDVRSVAVATTVQELLSEIGGSAQ
jgi:hypothetical protein